MMKRFFAMSLMCFVVSVQPSLADVEAIYLLKDSYQNSEFSLYCPLSSFLCEQMLASGDEIVFQGRYSQQLNASLGAGFFASSVVAFGNWRAFAMAGTAGSRLSWHSAWKGVFQAKAFSKVALSLLGAGAVARYMAKNDFLYGSVWLTERAADFSQKGQFAEEFGASGFAGEEDAQGSLDPEPNEPKRIPPLNIDKAKHKEKSIDTTDTSEWLQAFQGLFQRLGLVERQDTVILQDILSREILHMNKHMINQRVGELPELSLWNLQLVFTDSRANKIQQHISSLDFQAVSAEAAGYMGNLAMREFDKSVITKEFFEYSLKHLHHLFCKEIMDFSVFSHVYYDIVHRLARHGVEAHKLSPLVLRSRLQDFYHVEIARGKNLDYFPLHEDSFSQDLAFGMDVFFRGLLANSAEAERFLDMSHDFVEVEERKERLVQKLREYIEGSANLYRARELSATEVSAIARRQTEIKFRFLDTIAASSLIDIVDVDTGEDPLAMEGSFFSVADQNFRGWVHHEMRARLSDSLDLDLHTLDLQQLSTRLRDFYRAEIQHLDFDKEATSFVAEDSQRLDKDIFIRLFLARNKQVKMQLTEDYIVSGEQLLHRSEQLEDRLTDYMLSEDYLAAGELLSDSKVYARVLKLSEEKIFEILYGKYLFDLESMKNPQAKKGLVKSFYELFIHNEDSSLYAYRRDVYYHMLLSLGGYNHGFVARKLALKHDRSSEDIHADSRSLQAYLRMFYLSHMDTPPEQSFEGTMQTHSEDLDMHMGSDVYHLDRQKLLQHIRATLSRISRNEQDQDMAQEREHLEDLEALRDSLSLYIKHLRIERVKKLASEQSQT